MKVEVDIGRCCGTGFCVEACPEVFALRGGFCEVKAEEVLDEELQRKCLQAAEQCSAHAILLKESSVKPVFDIRLATRGVLAPSVDPVLAGQK
jgi:ferredoxin